MNFILLQKILTAILAIIMCRLLIISTINYYKQERYMGMYVGITCIGILIYYSYKVLSF